ncbi:Aminopeptidase 2 mitochondrial [Agyrium rufum]|nr:Aminopeptidase 2 mitochondrial [Agyrium rufum]
MCGGRFEDGGVTTTPPREVLPSHVKPVHYDLTLEPNFKGFTYDGTVVIDLDVKEDTSSISLNTLEIDITSTKVTSDGSEVSSSPKISYNANDQVCTISFDQSLKAGTKAQLTQVFKGTLNDQMAGFYRSEWKGKDGSKQWMATTQFEPTDARRAFPCFDEPALKATYTVTLIGDLHHTCLSNMPQASEKEIESKITGSKRKAVTFDKTPIMSTYLLAFIISELTYIENNDFRIPVRVYAPPDQEIEHGRFAVELGAKTLGFYEKVFDSPFPLPKMDMIAIPDFSAGAMENWGLVMYRVSAIMIDPKTASGATKERVAEVVQHELAHQWFGNLVTMDFWDGLWLNEGFATWMSWYSCNHFFPEWKVWESYVTGVLQQALNLDSMRSSHPVEVPVTRADQVNEIFDSISYAKGSCVIRMVSTWLGEETFMEGIRRYLKKHAYGNTTTSDLWAALSDASGKPVEKSMDIWTRHVGYPVVTVIENSDGKSVHLEQNRFLKTGDVEPSDDKTLYPVFLGLKTKEGTDAGKVFSERETNLNFDTSDFFKLNAEHAGFYRTSYSASRMSALGEAAKKGLLSVEDRAGMISDASALAASGYQKTSALLSLLKSFNDEPEYVVWQGILSAINNVRAAWVFEDEETRNALIAFQNSLVADKAHAKGWTFSDGEDHNEQQFKALLFSSAAQSNDPKAVQACKDMFAKFTAGDPSAIHPNLRGAVYANVLRLGGKEEYEAVLEEYKTSKDAMAKTIALSTLGRARAPELRQRTGDFALSEDVRSQDVIYPFIGMRNDADGIKALWEFVKNNWKAVTVKCPPSLGMLSNVVKFTCSDFTHPEDIEEVQNFFNGKSTKGFERALEQSLDSIRAKVGWLKRDGEDVKAWLEKEGFYEKAKQVKSEL